MPTCELNFEDPDFDVIDCVNKQFPNEQSLSTIEEHIANVKEKIQQHDEEISAAIRCQTIIEREGRDELDKATSIISELMQRIIDLKCQAKKSEQTVNEITCDIKQLDNAKRNLTSAVTMLNNLHILVESVEKLKEIYNKNEYRQTASILAGIQDVMKQFSDYKHIPQINHLSSEIGRLCDNINERINFDFKRVFEVPTAKHSISKDDIKLIAEACLVASLLGEEFREKLISWFLELQLTEYSALFKDSQISMSSLNGVDKRYSWLKKHLLEFEEKYGFLFPPPWQMSERMAVEFCRLTRESLVRVMTAYPNEVKLDSFVFAMTKTTAFETLLAKRFGSDGLQQSEDNDVSVRKFDGIISSCLEPYSHVFIKSQETAIQNLLEQLVEEHQKMMKVTNKDQKSIIFPSSNKFFQQYKNSLVQCVQLTNKSPLLDLHDVFKRYLREYAFRVLQMHLKVPSSSTSIPLKKIPYEASSGKLFSVATYGAAGLLQSFLRDAERNKIEPNQICSVILTADYCYETTHQLERKLKERIDPNLVARVDLKSELEIFTDLIKICIQLLIQHPTFAARQKFVEHYSQKFNL